MTTTKRFDFVINRKPPLELIRNVIDTPPDIIVDMISGTTPGEMDAKEFADRVVNTGSHRMIEEI